jgi:hypothetical protein
MPLAQPQEPPLELRPCRLVEETGQIVDGQVVDLSLRDRRFEGR